MYSSSIEQESGYFTQELSLDIDYWSHFVFTSITFEILFTKILDFFNMWVFVRTSSSFAHLASFQAIEFMDWPVQKTLGISVCETSENTAFFTKNAAFCNCSRRTRRQFNLISTLCAFRYGRTMKHVLPSFVCMCQQSCFNNTERGKKPKFEFAESTGKLEHTLMKGKWCNFIIWCLVVLYPC